MNALLVISFSSYLGIKSNWNNNNYKNPNRSSKHPILIKSLAASFWDGRCFFSFSVFFFSSLLGSRGLELYTAIAFLPKLGFQDKDSL